MHRMIWTVVFLIFASGCTTLTRNIAHKDLKGVALSYPTQTSQADAFIRLEFKEAIVATHVTILDLTEDTGISVSRTIETLGAGTGPEPRPMKQTYYLGEWLGKTRFFGDSPRPAQPWGRSGKHEIHVQVSTDYGLPLAFEKVVIQIEVE